MSKNYNLKVIVDKWQNLSKSINYTVKSENKSRQFLLKTNVLSFASNSKRFLNISLLIDNKEIIFTEQEYEIFKQLVNTPLPLAMPSVNNDND